MDQIFANSLTIGVVLSIAIYQAMSALYRKYPFPVLNPIISTTVILIAFLSLCEIEYASYYNSAKYLEYLLVPTTVCLAIPLYQKLDLLKANYKAIFVGVISGLAAGMGTILGLAVLFGFSHEEYVTLLPKSVTTAIAIGISEELGGVVSITIAAVIITGIIGNATAEKICKLCCIKHPVAVGIAMGTSAHAIGTSKAMQIGEIEGAMSSLALVIAGLVTTIGASFFAILY